MSQLEFPETASEAAGRYLVSASAQAAARGVQSATASLTKWISANDAGVTGTHQSGFHIPKKAWSLFFDRPGEHGENFDRPITIEWADIDDTESRAKWYGTGTRSEYRLTRFGPGFPYRGDNHVGSLLVIHTTGDPDRYGGHVLSTDDEIDEFLSAAGMTAGDVGRLLRHVPDADECLDHLGADALRANPTFPTTEVMSKLARAAAERCLGVTAGDPDRAIANWTEVEFRLFRRFEDRAFTEELAHGPIGDVERLISLALPFVNRRKARAGRSLEHHIAACLDEAGLSYQAQARTEGSNTMDFVFPSQDAYDDPTHPAEQLLALGAKTSAKERWRQVLEEADRVPVKHLLTLQPIAAPTIEAMIQRGLIPVVPAPYQSGFEKRIRSELLTVQQFIAHAEATIGR